MSESSSSLPSSPAAATWLDFWFTPVDAAPLAAVRMLTGLLGLLLAWSFGGDLIAWFGAQGMIPPDAVDGWRPRTVYSPLDALASSGELRLFFGALVVSLVAVTVGFASQIACVVAALLWAALLNRAPMLVGPADDCLAVLLWCLAVGPCGAKWSIDRWLRERRRLPTPGPSPWASTSLGLLRVHAAAITFGVLLSQLKGDVWWNGTAAWWLAAAHESDLANLTALYRRSEYLVNFVTHGIIAFEMIFATGIWFDGSRRVVALIGIVAWPVIGVLAAEPFFGLAMAIVCVPWVWSRRS